MSKAYFNVDIKAVSCTNLPSGSTGACDAYVKFIFDNDFKDIKTPTASKDHNPKYDFSVSFTYKTQYLNRLDQKVLKVQVFHHWKIYRDEQLGAAQVSLHTIATGPDRQDLQLFTKRGKAAGSIQFHVTMSQVLSQMICRLSDITFPEWDTALLYNTYQEFLPSVSIQYHFSKIPSKAPCSEDCAVSSGEAPFWSGRNLDWLKFDTDAVQLRDSCIVIIVWFRMNGLVFEYARTKLSVRNYLVPIELLTPFSEDLVSTNEQTGFKSKIGKITGKIIFKHGPAYAQMSGGTNYSRGVDCGTPFGSSFPLPKTLVKPPPLSDKLRSSASRIAASSARNIVVPPVSEEKCPYPKAHLRTPSEPLPPLQFLELSRSVSQTVPTPDEFHHQASAQILRIAEFFNSFDVNHDGKIQIDELISGFRRLGFTLEVNDILELVRLVDADTDHELNFKEFQALLQIRPDIQSTIQQHSTVAEQFFSEFDKNHDGKLQLYELINGLRGIGANVRERDVIPMIQAVDENGDYELGIYEFQILLQQRADVLQYIENARRLGVQRRTSAPLSYGPSNVPQPESPQHFHLSPQPSPQQIGGTAAQFGRPPSNPSTSDFSQSPLNQQNPYSFSSSPHNFPQPLQQTPDSFPQSQTQQTPPPQILPSSQPSQVPGWSDRPPELYGKGGEGEQEGEDEEPGFPKKAIADTSAPDSNSLPHSFDAEDKSDATGNGDTSDLRIPKQRTPPISPTVYKSAFKLIDQAQHYEQLNRAQIALDLYTRAAAFLFKTHRREQHEHIELDPKLASQIKNYLNLCLTRIEIIKGTDASKSSQSKLAKADRLLQKAEKERSQAQAQAAAIAGAGGGSGVGHDSLRHSAEVVKLYMSAAEAFMVVLKTEKLESEQEIHVKKKIRNVLNVIEALKGR